MTATRAASPTGTLDALLAAAADPAALRAAAAADPDLADRLVETLVQRAEVDLLDGLDAPGLPAGLRKAARRGLHALRTRGVRAGGAPRVGRLAVEAAVAGEPEAEAWIAVAPPAANLLLVVRTPAERRLLAAVIDEEERIVEGAAVSGVARRGVREYIERHAAGGIHFVPAPPGHVAGRLRAAVTRPASPHGPEAAAVRAKLVGQLSFAASLAEAGHPARALAPPREDDVAAEARRLAAAFSEEDVPFALDRATLRVLLERLDQVRASPLVLSSGTTAAREDEVVRAFAAGELSAGFVAGLGLRFLDRAWVRRAGGDEVGARADASAGVVLLDGAGSPAAREILEVYVRSHLRKPEDGEEGAGSPEGGGLIIG